MNLPYSKTSTCNHFIFLTKSQNIFTLTHLKVTCFHWPVRKDSTYKRYLFKKWQLLRKAYIYNYIYTREIQEGMSRIGSEIYTSQESIFFSLKDRHETDVRSSAVDFPDGNSVFEFVWTCGWSRQNVYGRDDEDEEKRKTESVVQGSHLIGGGFEIQNPSSCVCIYRHIASKSNHLRGSDEQRLV